LDSAVTKTRHASEGDYFFRQIDASLQRLLDFPAELVGQDDMALVARIKASLARNAAQLEEAARTLKRLEQDYQIGDGKDPMRWIRHSMSPRRQADGTVVFSGVMRDVTREKEAEDQVEMLRSVVVRSSDSIVIFESDSTAEDDTRIVYVNTKFTDLFGWSVDEVVGKPGAFLVANRPIIGCGALAATLLRNDGEPVEFETSSRDGRVFWVEARVSIIQRFDNGRFRWVVISHDISDRRRSQDELLRAKKEAEAGNRAKGDFLANMSHELRTPLNAIIGFTELIHQGVTGAGWLPRYLEYLADVSQSGRHLLDLINTILDLSQIEAGQLKLELAPVDLCELIRRSVSLASGAARDGGVTLSICVPFECLEVAGDYLKLKQALLNVVSNAIKFTQPGGAVSVTLTANQAAATIGVADTGCGIRKADLERVALPFMQGASNLSRRFGGSGLGLSIAHELCRLHNGRLDIDSIEGQGTTVRISLPREGCPKAR